MFRIGVVGCGGIARRHMEGWRAALDGLGEAAAVCDVNPAAADAFADEFGVPLRFDDPLKLIESGEVDVLALLTPPSARLAVALPAMERGLHLLIEKPFAESLSDALTMTDAAEDAGVQLAVNQQTRFLPEARELRRLIDSGALGEIRFAAHEQHQRRDRTTGWRANESRLEISIFSIHLLDRLRWLVGEAVESVSCAARAWDSAVKGETFSAARLEFDGGAVGVVTSNWHSLGLPECRLRIDGTEGSALAVKSQLLADETTLRIGGRDGRSETRTLRQPEAFVRALGESMKRLLEAVRDGAPPVHSGRDNLETMAVVDAAYLSAERDGGRVLLEELWQNAR